MHLTTVLVFMLFHTFVYASDHQKLLHIVYSPPFYEKKDRVLVSHENSYSKDKRQRNERLIPSRVSLCSSDPNVMTFDLKRIQRTPYCNERWQKLGDDDTSFFNSQAMEFSLYCTSLSFVEYPDASSNCAEGLSKTRLYTQESIHALSNHLYERVITEKRHGIALIGPSVGGSIILATLNRLSTFSNNKDYFSSTLVKSEEDAQAIIDAVNKGFLVLINPLLKLESLAAVRVTSSLVSGLVIGALLKYIACASPVHDFDTITLSTAALLLPTYSFLKKITQMVIRFCIVPVLTYGHYDPYHEDPIDAIEGLSGKIKCRTLLNVSERDKIVDWKNEWFIRLYETLQKNCNLQLHIDKYAAHMQMPYDLRDDILPRFYGDFFFTRNKRHDCNVASMVYPYGMLSRAWREWKIPLVLIWCFMAYVIYQKEMCFKETYFSIV